MGSIQQTYTPQSAVRKGAEKGYFAFGGSAVMTIFPKNTLILADDLVRNSASGIETYARMGDTMGHLCTTPDV
ncbi:MAG: phosphatidylserine decarboxylase [Verrucomicrobia bacterium]|nr:phosphatidylserine decarboxylase [Verrucomicrobiota bacterium]